MDIYSFIESKDIREYLKKKEYKFTTPEAAFLVWHCRRKTMKEKFTAWNEIIRTMPDCEMQARSDMAAIPDFHLFLRRYMELQKTYIGRFMGKGDSLYFYDFCENNNDGIGPFDSFQRCRDAAFSIGISNETDKIHIFKKKVNPDTEYQFVDSCNLNLKGEILDVDLYLGGEQKEDFETAAAFEGMWFDFPTPFKAGDILHEISDPDEEKPCVLVRLSTWKEERLRKIRGEFFFERFLSKVDRLIEKFRKKGGISDMRAYGFQIDNGLYSLNPPYIVEDDFGFADYLDLEYCRKTPDGVNSFLLPVSKYLKGEYDLEFLINSYVQSPFELRLQDGPKLC